MIQFAPLLPWPVLAALALVILPPAILALRANAHGTVSRLAGLLLLLAVLAGPQRVTRGTSPLPDIAILLADHSQSMVLGNRAALRDQAIASLRESAGGVTLDLVDIPAAASGGTALDAGLSQALGSIQPDQLAGIIAITDGEVSLKTPLPPGIPFTALLTAKGEETDRELRLLNTPSYGLVGQNRLLELEVLDHGVSDAGAKVPVTVTQDGQPFSTVQAVIGTPFTVGIPIRHAGKTVITAAAAALQGEVSPVNDQAGFTLTGIQKRLRILLISGRPNPSERAWRVALKSDPAVQLIHFTILRLPGEAIDADPQDLALVPFPVRELFETDLPKFDLIILDSFDATGLLPPDYLGNIASYVRAGGALLAETGPEFEMPDSLAASPLAPVLPASPAAPGTVETPFAPAVTPFGARHPVTAPLAGMDLPEWYRIEAATPGAGDVLMSGANGLPLLILGRQGKGRAALLLSDQLWLWSRAAPHTGPVLPLLRRIVYWLLREPDLEAESLTATLAGPQLEITRQTLSENYPGDARITAPDGTSTLLKLAPLAPGRFGAATPVPESPGLWKVTEGGFTAYATGAEPNTQEFQDLAATGTQLQPIARTLLWLGTTPAPPLQTLLRERHARETVSLRFAALLPPVPSMLLALALWAGAWWRESRTRT